MSSVDLLTLCRRTDNAMLQRIKAGFAVGLAGLLISLGALAQNPPSAKVVDVPTRTGVSQRLLVLSPPAPKAAVILFAGGHGGLQIFPNGSFNWGDGNFLMRSRQLFVDQGLLVIVLDAQSDAAGAVGKFRCDHVSQLWHAG